MNMLCRLGGLTLTAILALTGCGGTEPDTPVSAMITDDITGVDITHCIGGETTQWTAEGEEVDPLRKWASGLQSERIEFEEGESPGDQDGGEFFEFALTGGELPAFCYVVNGTDACYLLMEEQWYSVSNPSDPPVQEPGAAKLTLENVTELAEKGDALTWDDFQPYDGEDIGFGLYILRFQINGNYYLTVGGVPDDPPWYIRLVSAEEDSDYIDIRTESVKDFLDR